MTSRQNINKFTTGIISVILSSGFFMAYADQNLPEGGHVVEGTAHISTAGHTLDVNTSTAKSIIEWNSFNIGQNYGVNVHQPGSDSVSLNRVVGGNPSSIMGALSSNGRLFLVNPNGIVFGPHSHVDTAGLLASTLQINNQDFLSGKNTFYQEGNPGWIINQGQLNISNGGYVALLSNVVVNGGTIHAPLGKVLIGSAQKMTVPLDDNNGISIAINESVKSNVFGPTGEQFKDAIANSGSIEAPGGSVTLSARALKGLFDNAINNSGIISANALVNRNGQIMLVPEAGAFKNSGTIEAKGGKVILDPRDITIASGGTTLVHDNPQGTPDEAFSDDTNVDITIDPASLASLKASEVYLQATRDIFVNSDLILTTPISLEAGRNIVLGATLSSTSTITLNAQTGGVINGSLNNGLIQADQLIANAATGIGEFHHEIHTAINALTAKVTDVGVIYLSNDRSLILNDVQTLAGHINIYSAGPMTAKKARILTDNGLYDLRLQASGGLIVGDVYSGNSNDAKLQTFSGTIEDDGDPNTTETADALWVDAAEGIGTKAPLDLNINILMATSRHGNVTVTNRRPNLTISYFDAADGKVNFTSMGDTYVERLTNTTGDLNLDSKGLLNVHNVSTVNGNVNLTAENGDLHVINVQAGGDTGAAILTATKGSITVDAGTTQNIKAHSASLQVPQGTIGVNAPIDVNTTGALDLKVGGQQSGVSARLTGTVGSGPVVSGATAESMPPGTVIFNGTTLFQTTTPPPRTGDSTGLFENTLRILQQRFSRFSVAFTFSSGGRTR